MTNQPNGTPLDTYARRIKELERELAALRRVRDAARMLTIHYQIDEIPTEKTVTLKKYLWDALKAALESEAGNANT